MKVLFKRYTSGSKYVVAPLMFAHTCDECNAVGCGRITVFYFLTETRTIEHHVSCN